MHRNTGSIPYLCLAWACLVCLPALATTAQQPANQPPTGAAVRVAMQAKSKATKPGSSKAISTTAPPKSTPLATAKTREKPGKRFWSRIMGVFRDVHSVEKKTNP